MKGDRIPASEFEPGAGSGGGAADIPSAPAAGAPYGSLGEAALYYLSQGLSVIPLRPREKVPAVAWDEYQERRPTEEEVKRWWVENPGYNIGIVTGRVSGNLMVIDFDDLEVAKGILGRVGAGAPGGAEKLKHTWVVRTGKGLHVYVRLEDPESMPRTRAGAGEKVDFRADGGQAVAPPSVHPSGARYEWLRGHAPWETQVAVLSADEWRGLLKIVAPWYAGSEGAAPEGVGGVRRPIPPLTRELSDDEVNEIAKALRDCMVKGHRNAIIYRLVAMMIEHGVTRESAKKVVGTLMAVARSPGTPDEIREELANVDYHYRNDPGEAKLEGRPSLMAECEKALMEVGTSFDNAVRKADAAVGAVVNVLRRAKPPEEIAPPTPAESAPTSPYLRDALAWWRNNFSLPADADEWKAARVASYLTDALLGVAHIRFVKVCTDRGCELYAVDGSKLVDAGAVIDEAIGAPGVRDLQSAHLPTMVRRDLAAMARPAAPEELNPPHMLNTPAGVLDLRTLELLPHGGDGPYFTYEAPVRPEAEVLTKIRVGQYKIEENQVHKLWREHFDEENWWYFVSSVGTWLYPKRFRHLAWLVGARGTGKSSLLGALTRAIDPIVARISLDHMLSYTFGMQGLIGKQIIVQNERAVGVLRNLDVLNRIFGENDYVDVQRKHRDPIAIPSMRSAMFSMNDLPLLEEKHGSTLDAFIDRLSIIEMSAPEGFSPKRGIMDEVRNEEALYFLLWARQHLEEAGEVIEKRSEDELRGMVFEGAWVLAEFWNSCIEEVHGEKVPAKDVRAAYLVWAKERGVSTVGRNEFYDLMAQRTTKMLDVHLRAPVFIGIRVKPGCRPGTNGTPESELM
jgi:hypothetical protein